MSEPRDLRSDALGILRDVLEASDARHAVLRAVGIEGTALRVGNARFDLDARPLKIYSVALGKAASAMASALDARLGDRLARGVLSAPSSDVTLSERWRIFNGGHPLPNESSMDAARAAFELLREANKASALVVFLVSGGGSAMVEVPRDGRVTLDDLREANRVLVSCGAGIAEVNAVRRALSAVKGGGLSARAPLASQVTLVVSDVAAGRAYDVASGPTIAPPPDALDVKEIVERHGLASRLPASILRALEESHATASHASATDAHASATDNKSVHDSQSHQSRSPDTQSQGTRSHYVLLDNASACEAAAESARGRGFAVSLASDITDQPVGEGAASLVSRLVSLFGREGVETRGMCLISGGEFACPVRGGGVGGRNSETALRCSFEFERILSAASAFERSGVSEFEGESPGACAVRVPTRLVALCAGTDGIDGNSPAAGALADNTTLARSRALGLDARKFLDESDAHTFFDLLGDAVVTGATGTNVRDVRILLATKS